MPGRDGTGPQGYGPLTGGRHGCCAGDGAAAGRGYGRGGGHGWRNQYLATGLTGRQRADQSGVEAAPATAAPDTLARLDEKLSEVLHRLDRLESARRD